MSRLLYSLDQLPSLSTEYCTFPSMDQSMDEQDGSSKFRDKSYYLPYDTTQIYSDNNCKRRFRTNFTEAQSAMLEDAFRASHYPDQQTKKNMATALSIPEDRVTVWFQNRRAKWRRKETRDKDKKSSSSASSSSSTSSTSSDRITPMCQSTQSVNQPIISSSSISSIVPNLSLLSNDISLPNPYQPSIGSLPSNVYVNEYFCNTEQIYPFIEFSM